MANKNVAGVYITKPNEPPPGRVKVLSLLLWGATGCGKTPLACTAPGRILLLNFDPNGPDSVAHFPNVDVADFSDSPDSILERGKSDTDPFGLKSVVNDYDSFVVDSITNAAYKATMHGVSNTKGSTVERPATAAYQVRNALALQLTKNMLRFTRVNGKHLVIVAHEASPVTDDEGNVMYITIMLGGQLPNQSSIDFSEIWFMEDKNNIRSIFVRPREKRKPVRTRMFDTSQEGTFRWTYNANTMRGPTLEKFYNAWRDNNFQKIPLPR